MPRSELRRLLGGAQRRAFEEVAGLFGGPLCVEDEHGAVVFGDEAAGADPGAPAGAGRYPVVVDGAALGTVRGGPGADRVARLLAAFAAREREKRALADETLERYKELTLLYGASERLSGSLDVGEVARTVAEEARRFLRARSAAVLLLNPRRGTLDAIAVTGDEPTPLQGLPAAAGLEGRVLATGRAEFVHEAAAPGPDPAAAAAPALLCAPLRSGETAFGLLRVTGDRPERWTAGDLKLVTSIAANAAAAISHAMLHRDRLRQQALRSRIERHVSPHVIAYGIEEPAAEARRDAGAEPPPGGRPLAVLVCDLGLLAQALDPVLSPESVLRAIEEATSLVLDEFMQRGALVNLARGELLVALFPREPDFAAAARTAARAALAVAARLDGRLGARSEHGPGIGIACAHLDPGGDPGQLLQGVGAAATLQAAAQGRILVDEEVARAIAGVASCVPAQDLDRQATRDKVYEVRT